VSEQHDVPFSHPPQTNYSEVSGNNTAGLIFCNEPQETTRVATTIASCWVRFGYGIV